MPETRVPFDVLNATLESALRSLGVAEGRASTSARMFAETQRDGVYTHGIARFPRLVAQVKAGIVSVTAEPTLAGAFGAMERWDGQAGMGNLNAKHCMDRAIRLAGKHGIGCVSLRNTNHWMRGGTYGWLAADAGLIGLCWTNTMPNLPPWGGTKPLTGNNPLVIAVPRARGAIVLDMAMSQYSYGTLAEYRREGRQLPYPGGMDADGELTRDPAAIEASQRALPIGYWKGTGLSMLLDTLAATLAMGLATHQIANDPLRETGLSQVFLAIDPRALGEEDTDRIADDVIASLRDDPGSAARYPGERVHAVREESMRLGVLVSDDSWQQVQAIANGTA